MTSVWDSAPTITIFVYPPDPPTPCPYCGHGKPIINRTFSNGDNSSTRQCVCRRCSERFKVAVETIATSGNSTEDVW